jgi:hypothetical protein
VQYQDVGLIVEVEAGAFLRELQSCGIKFKIKCSSVGQSKAEVAPEVFAPIFRYVDHQGEAMFKLDEPQVFFLLDNGEQADGATLCRVVRMVLMKG